LNQKQAQKLLDSVDTSTLSELRDRAIIGVMVYSFARVSAVVGMNAKDYYQNGKKWWFRRPKKEESSMKFQPITIPKLTWMPISKRQPSPWMTRRFPYSALSEGEARQS
jgi:integrase